MKAIVCTNYGPPEVLELRDVDRPTPKAGDVLIKVFTTAVTSGDCRMRSLNLTGVPLWERVSARLALALMGPKGRTPGLCLAGEVEATGAEAHRFKKGDQVYVETTTGMRLGAYAEYACVADDGILALIPPGVTYEQAVAAPFGALSALFFLRKAEIQPREKILVYGASGAVGTAAVQLATHVGAGSKHRTGRPS